ncbi:hypothetical protein CEUSTIGMA_g9689.t1 [Chlamydomonas eustigma]|uniref:Uridine diphosphate glucose pyrophosphatase NUDT14 n=1 Tax=Chlamydomonas eustigma TaxID=1157962 RepID=A0A250XGQ7_9CHLO|nr:hypothetical protein CEUSTIGMA_g9689.t1 [Chlamydomonas eustigma]|eukprot:GAX82261.1 hypothetical protein CEUSTIGMA_g9689.t1 [Chlamydomonas eustigma]
MASENVQNQFEKHYPYELQAVSGPSMVDMLQRVGPSFEEVPLIEGESKFVKPSSLLYQLDGRQKRWDAVESHDSVGIVVHHKEWKGFLIVRQFRPPVFAAAWRKLEDGRSGSGSSTTAAPSKDVDMEAGFTFELCAGIIDKELSLKGVASEEIEEELGYKVIPQDLLPLTSAIASAGTSGSKHYMFYAEVDESMRVGAGGGLADHGEMIEVLCLPREKAMSFVMDGDLNKSPGLLFGILWALNHLKGDGA